MVQGREKAGVPLAINGIFGNMGVACAALITGFLIDHAGCRSAFVWPGIVSIATGIIYAGFLYLDRIFEQGSAHPRICNHFRVYSDRRASLSEHNLCVAQNL